MLAVLCLAAYAPALPLPLIEDDYPLISLAAQSGPLGVLADPVFRVRATSIWAMLLLYKWFALKPWIYHGFSLVVHFVNTWLLYRICLEVPRLRPGGVLGRGVFRDRRRTSGRRDVVRRHQ